MMLRALALCVSAVLAAEQASMELPADVGSADHGTTRLREPTMMDVEFIEETAPPLERANGIEITALTEDIADAVPPREFRERPPVPTPSGNYLPTTNQDIPYTTVQQDNERAAELPPAGKMYATSSSVRSGYQVGGSMAGVSQASGCGGPSVRTIFRLQGQGYPPSPGQPQLVASYVAAPPSVPYAVPQGASVTAGYGRRKKRSRLFPTLQKLLQG